MLKKLTDEDLAKIGAFLGKLTKRSNEHEAAIKGLCEDLESEPTVVQVEAPAVTVEAPEVNVQPPAVTVEAPVEVDFGPIVKVLEKLQPDMGPLVKVVTVHNKTITQQSEIMLGLVGEFKTLRESLAQQSEQQAESLAVLVKELGKITETNMRAESATKMVLAEVLNGIALQGAEMRQSVIDGDQQIIATLQAPRKVHLTDFENGQPTGAVSISAKKAN